MSSQERASADVAISVRRLCKRYGGQQAVDGGDLEVERGEIFAVLGPNGAGKTTTMEILEGYRTRDGGEVQVLGQDPGRQVPPGIPGSGSCCRRPGLQRAHGPGGAVAFRRLLP
jgi:ABC-type branched-subunit amino acid transport system ATPase component